MSEQLIRIYKADSGDVPDLLPLWENYRGFYHFKPDPSRSQKFLSERLNNQESVLFIAEEAETNKKAGFIQLYPYFSSVRMVRTWLLNDLFVQPDFRRKGIARMLMLEAGKLAEETGAGWLMLETGNENFAAQKLYESLGYVPDEQSRYYYLRYS